jgi:hypothetical protein
VSRAADVLAELHSLHVEVCANGDRLRLSGPADALTPELKARVLQAKPELLRLLATPTQVRPLVAGLAVREVLAFAAALLPDLPVPTTLVVHVPRIAEPISLAAHPDCRPATFDCSEWLELVLAVENDRAFWSHFCKWCERKRSEPQWRLTEADALGEIYNAMPRQWSVARVLGRLGVALRAVVIEGGIGH